jgi:hypothetical protein
MFFLIWIIVGWSITSILVNGTIFDSVRNYLIVKTPPISKLMTCIQCSGFWVGVFLGICSMFYLAPDLFIFVSHSNLIVLNLFKIVLYGFFNSGISVLLDSLVFYLIKEKNNF